MSVIKVPEIKAPTPNRNRNAFDLSQRHLFTAHAGMLLPVLSLDLLPDDHVEINASDFMRTLPMNTAAFASMRGVYEFFYVPYHQLWRPFDQFITGMKDYNSSVIQHVYENASPTSIPSFSLKNFYNVLNSSEDNEFVDYLGYNRTAGSYRLLDLLGYSRLYNSSLRTYVDEKGTTPDTLLNGLDFKCNLFRILAYNKIYYDYYRNSTYESMDCDLFNIDDAGSSGFTDDFLKRLFELRYRNCQNDYFTNVRPSILFSDGLSGSVLLNRLDPFSGDYTVSPNDNAVSFVIDDPQSSSSGNSFSVQSLRAAFALDKLASTSMRAGKTFYEQMAAHYGVKINDGRDGRVTYIGGFDSDIQVSDVTQVSGSSANSDASLAGHLGKIAGKGTGSGSGRVVFDAKEHGVLMCIYSLVPQLQYDCTRIDPMVQKLNRFDFFTPEFENLGLQPLCIDNVTTINTKQGSVVGYQPRYSEYKTALDINHGQFANKDSLSYWSVGRFRKQGGFKKFDITMLKINPNMLDSIFPVDYNGKENTDCVFGGCNFNIVKVSSMSVDGMPRV